MLNIHQFALYLHIAVGSCALIVFWVPALTRKGNLNHKRFGRYFAAAMYTVALSGILMATLDMLMPVAMHAPGVDLTAQERVDVTTQVRNFALFLGSLSVLVLVSARQGWLAILAKEDRAMLRTPLHTLLCGALLTVGVALLINGVISGSVLYLIFAGFQIVSAVTCLHYNFKAALGPKEWWIEHLRGLIGAGIGAFTAFTVFGGRAIFDSVFGDSFANAAIVLWIAPGVIGGVAIGYLSRHYKVRFGGEWAVKRAATRSTLFSQ